MTSIDDKLIFKRPVGDLCGKFHAHLTLCTKEKGLQACEEFCREHRVKLTVVDLESSTGQAQTDVMTTSHYKDEKTGAVARILRQLSKLAEKASLTGFPVGRIKLEHESQPSLPYFDAEHYHEVHFKLKIAKTSFAIQKLKLKELGSKCGFVVSRNPRQVAKDFIFQFANIRIYEGTHAEADQTVGDVQKALADNGFEVEQLKRETVILDTAHEMDAWWT